ncbi:MAG: nitroreductase [Hamadaea sp.]|nr:nitroreductase [Hamadaea sp.]
MTTHSASAVLAQAAAAAGFAPSVLNTQPWRWRVAGETLELHAERSRQLAAIDSEGRLLVMSCGAALHHVVVALAAEGWQPEVVRLPDPAVPDLLAKVTLGPHIGVTPEAMRHFQTLRLRRTDRRPVAAEPVTADQIDVVRRAGTAPGVDVHRLTPEQVTDLGVAAAHADELEMLDPSQRQELAYWVGGDRPDGTGVPSEVIPQSPPPGVVPGRDFVRGGSLPASGGSDRAAVYLMLFGPTDTPADWVRAGEAMSAAWLTATEVGLSVLPFSSVIEVGTVRESLRRGALASLGYPYIVLRVGNADPDHSAPAHTPRLPAEQTISLG